MGVNKTEMFFVSLGQSQVIGTSQPIVAMVGDDAILPCHLNTAVDATNLTVGWVRPDFEPRIVHLRHDGVEHQLEKHKLYMGRISLSTNELKCGDISLKLSKVEPSDAGTYRCFVPKFKIESVVVHAVGKLTYIHCAQQKATMIHERYKCVIQ